MIPLIDGDILCYRVGFAAERDEWPICRSRLDEFLYTLLSKFDASDYFGWLTEGSGNYRHQYAKTLPYKGQRPGTKPKHYEAIRNWLVNEWEFEVESEQEADDAIGIKATELGDDALICTIDKDLDNIPGWHYNFAKRVKYYVNEAEATRNFYRQILTGDRIDNVLGLRGIGPIKADRILGASETTGCSEDFFRRCVEAYDGDSERVIENARLLWIRRHPDEIWNPPC